MFPWRNSRPWLVGVCLVLGFGGLLQSFFVINTTPSFPEGLYLKTWQQPQKGSLVLLCPPDWPVFREALQRRFLAAGLCAPGSGYMIKQVVAAHGDSIRINQQFVSVNGAVLPHSAQRMVLGSAGSFETQQTVQQGEVLLMSPHPWSFDARYFGPLPAQCLITTLSPVYIWE